jgi:RHS repeat-associated protein
VSLPKGGGAIRGIGETFSNNPVTGTSGLSIPLPLSPGRAGFTPSLALSYDSGAGNGPFGFGWTAAIPAITRRTDRGLPRYFDDHDSDTYLLSGAEDLVPVLRADGTRHEETRDGYRVRRYRPRLEGLFARIERWSRLGDPRDTHWRSISRDNVTTVYGKTSASRIADPNSPSRIFTWLACESFDSRGNAAVFDYVAEDSRGTDPTRASEATRTTVSPSAGRYLKRVRYGNRTSRLIEPDLGQTEWLFELVMDYGDHGDAATPEPSRPWPVRPDPFSTYRAGFEIRTYRRCHRVLMFHRFAELSSAPQLVRALDLDYDDIADPGGPPESELAHSGSTALGSFLRRATAIGYSDSGESRAMPPLELRYSRPTIKNEPRTLDRDSVVDLPGGVDGVARQWLDLDGEGIAGVFSEQAGMWWYKRNLGDGHLARAERLGRRPAIEGRAQFMDLGGDGQLDAVTIDPPNAGFYEREDGGWSRFVRLAMQPNVDLDDPDVRLVDLTGDGHADLFITQGGEISWHEALADAGFGSRERVPMPADEQSGPRIVFRDPQALVAFADMSGDGLSDIVRVRNGEVCYWPNLGYGRFGAKVTMDNPPLLDAPDQFEPRRIRLADIDGSGVTDIIYLSRDGVRLHFNRAGNGFTAAHRLTNFPQVDNVATVGVLDLLGLGTACLVWSTPLPHQAETPIHFIDLMGGVKPHLLVGVENNLGARTAITYAASTKFYLADRENGRPWATRLPFPVHVVERMEMFDDISKNRFTRRYVYHDGFFDGVEREFRGFAEIEQIDTEELSALGSASNIDASSHVPPVLTRTRFHTGAEAGGAVLPAGLTGDERREAVRALKGTILRQEVFALDGTPQQPLPYAVTEQRYEVRLVQSRGDNRHAVFLTHQRESVSSHTERRPEDPRVTHSTALEIDEFGNVLLSAAVAYGRKQADPALSPPDRARQTAIHVTYSQSSVTNAIDAPDDNRTPLAFETKSFELSGLAAPNGRYTPDELRAAFHSAAEIEYEVAPTAGVLQKRAIEHARSVFRKDDLSGALPRGQVEARALPFESLQLAFTPGLALAVYGDKISDALLAEGGYVHSDGDDRWWIPTGRIAYAPASATNELAEAQAHFFTARRYIDPFGNTTDVDFDAHDLLVVETRDALGNRVIATHDYRVLSPRLVTDPNGNRAEVAFDALGLVVGTAIMGKAFEQLGDSLAGFVAELPDDVISAHVADPLTDPHAILGRASTRLIYDLFAYARTKTNPAPAPCVVSTLARETHDADLAPGERTTVQHAFAYSDGFARVIQTKAQAEPGPNASPRWVASGWTVFDNKGQPVRKFEPFFADSHHYEPNVHAGVSSVAFYDPIGRVVGMLNPDHTWTKTQFDPWRQEIWDSNDTVLLDPKTDPQLGTYFTRLADAEYLPTWHARHTTSSSADEQAAASKAAAHAATPSIAHADSLGRTFLKIANTGSEQLENRVVFDIERNQREVIDALGRICVRYDYDMVGRVIHQSSMEAGQRWILADIAGLPISRWDSRGHQLRTHYDELRRPVDVRLGTIVVARTVYGEAATNAEQKNVRGKPIKQFDQAGVSTSEDYDFKGNLLSSERQVTRDYKGLRDWTNPTAVPLEAGAPFTRSTRYDALNRPILLTAPDGSVLKPRYNEANLLDRVDVNLRGSATSTPFITNIDYNARGQRIATQHGNGVRCTYTYEPDTFRLSESRSTRTNGDVLQDLRYTYDPVGNITHIADDAQQTIYFANQVVTASNDYSYDAIYRLIAAEGREHIGQVTRPETGPDDRFRTQLAHPQDGQAMRRYAEAYRYDGAGNILELIHRAEATTWTRGYTYAEASQVESNKVNNRLTKTTIAGGDEPYAYDVHGNLIAIPHLSSLAWNFIDQLESTSRQVVSTGTAETTFYVYDASGQRARKVTERQNGTRKHERLYLGDFEVFREYAGDGVTITLERETLHVAVGGRIALVETRSQGTDPGPALLIRYQLSNHLGSSTLELDDAAQVISYEEYYPYGSTSYQAVRSQTETPKRYRYTGMERDEETGFAYHSARYYAPWLARWTSADPSGYVDGVNLFRYARSNPVAFLDHTGTDSTPAPLGQLVKDFVQEAIAASRAAAARAAAAEAALVADAAPAIPAVAPAAAPTVGAGLASGAVVGAFATAGAILGTGYYTLIRSQTIAATGNPWGIAEPGLGLLNYARPWLARPVPPPIPRDVKPAPDQSPRPDPRTKPKDKNKDKDDDRDRKPRLGRIYVTYQKYNTKSTLYYSGRTSMVVDLNKPLRPQALEAVRLRDLNHHVDERDEPQSSAFLPAELDKFDVGAAVRYEDRYNDIAYQAIRGREQQLIDARGGSWSDTGQPYQTENKERGVAKDHEWGRVFHEMSNARFQEELHRYTGL